jgi:uncharacterized membrane protein YfcA
VVNWRVVVATVVSFLGSAFDIIGGGVFVPMLNLIADHPISIQ